MLDDQLVEEPWVEALIARSQQSFTDRGFGTWVATFADGTFVGECALQRVLRYDLVEVIYSIEPEHWGRGLATEAATAVVDFGFGTVGLDRIAAGVDTPNRASLAVVARLGLSSIGELVYDDGDLVPFYAVSRSDWIAARTANPRGDNR